MMDGMRGSITKGLRGGKAYAAYLESCAHGYGDYLEGHSGGLEFTRYRDGAEAERKTIDADGLELLLEGRDPDSGEVLKPFRDGTVRYYEFPINDTKLLDVAGVHFADVREARECAQERGEKAVKDYVSQHLTVRIRVGEGKRKWVHADEVMWASAEHQTSREGDPHMHRHLLLVNRVRVGDKWYAVDSVKLFGMYENIRSVYETTVYGDPELQDAMARNGMSLTLKGEVPELGDADKVFSKRTAQVDARLQELIEEWRRDPKRAYREVTDADGHVVGHTGYQTLPDMPDDKTLARLKIQAWHETRAAKGEWNTRVDWAAWDAELKAAGHDLSRLEPRSGTVGAAVADIMPDDVDLCALNAVADLTGLHSAWSLEQLEVAAYDQVRDLDVRGTCEEIADLAARITTAAQRLCVTLETDPRAAVPWAKNLTSSAVIECERDVRGRLAARGAMDTDHTPDAACGEIAERFTLDTGQRAAFETIAKGDPLTVVEGVAGAGKTHMLKAVKEHCDQTGGRLVLLTPTRKAAQVAAGETGATAETVMKLLEAYGWRHNEEDAAHPWQRMRMGETDHRGNVYRGMPAAYRMDGRTTLVVDEAGMLDQDQARALLHVADETGARLVLVGDRQQLTAVGRGGVLDMAREYTANTVTMLDVHRFKDPSYGDFSLRLHDRTRETAPQLVGEMRARGMIHRAASEEETIAAIAAAWMRAPQTTISTGTNDDANTVNAAIQAARLEAGQLGRRHCTSMVEGQMIHEGDRVMTRANDRQTGVANRQVWTAERIDRQGMTVRGDDGRRVRLTPDYVRASVQLGYASTAYGAQGITSPAGIVYASEGMTGAALYVGLTRGKAENHVYITADSDADADRALTGMLGRESGDHGVRAAHESVRQVIDEQPEPAAPPLSRTEKDELELMERWTKSMHAELSDRLAVAREETAAAEQARARANELDRKAAEARRAYKAAGRTSSARRDEWRAARDKAVRDIRTDYLAVLPLIDRDGKTGSLESQWRQALRDRKADLDKLRNVGVMPVVRLSDDRLHVVTQSLQEYTMGRYAQAADSMRRIDAELDEFQRKWGVDAHTIRDSVPIGGKRMAREIDRATSDAIDALPSIKELKAAEETAYRAASSAWGAMDRADARAREAREAVKEPQDQPQELQDKLDAITPTPDMTPRERYGQLSAVWRPIVMRRYERITAQTDDPIWERLETEREARPDDSRWRSPVVTQWDAFGSRVRRDLTLGQLLNEAYTVRPASAERLETMTVVQINQLSTRLKSQHAYRESWSDAARLSNKAYYAGISIKPSSSRADLIRQLDQMAEALGRRQPRYRNDAPEYPAPDYGTGIDPADPASTAGPTISGPTL